MGGCAEANCHFLHHTSHQKSENYEGQKETDTETCSSRSVGEHARTVVLAEHHENAGTDEQPEQVHSRQEAAPGTVLANLPAVVGAIDIFVSDDDARRGVASTIVQLCVEPVHSRMPQGRLRAVSASIHKNVNCS